MATGQSFALALQLEADKWVADWAKAPQAKRPAGTAEAKAARKQRAQKRKGHLEEIAFWNQALAATASKQRQEARIATAKSTAEARAALTPAEKEQLKEQAAAEKARRQQRAREVKEVAAKRRAEVAHRRKLKLEQKNVKRQQWRQPAQCNGAALRWKSNV